jgi:plastocyanin
MSGKRLPRRRLKLKKSLILIVPAALIATLVTAFFLANRTPDPAETLDPEPGEIVVRLTDDLRFEPSRVEIRVGQTVVWVNESEKTHTVSTHPEEATRPEHALVPQSTEHFDSSNLGPGQTFKRTFTVPGVYKYYCHPHQDMAMLGEVIVLEPGQTEPPPQDLDGRSERAREESPQTPGTSDGVPGGG